MKRKYIYGNSYALIVCIGVLFIFASCVSEEITKKSDARETNLTAFVAGNPESRTSLDYNSGDFFWGAGDKIYVQDDDGVWQESNNSPSGRTASFRFNVPGNFTNSNTYKVYYPGRNGSNDQVTIPDVQTQTTPNNTAHIGISGDCGMADATKPAGSTYFNFRLDHDAAILVFQPYTASTALQKNSYLTKIEVTSDNNITGTFTLNPTTQEMAGAGTDKHITLNMIPTGSTAKGFSLNTASANVTTNGAYMVIKPGTHQLTVHYWIKDYGSNVEAMFTKTLPSFNYLKNNYYDMTAELEVIDYDGDHYYAWDGDGQYWKGHEWTHGNPGWQPTLVGQVSTVEPNRDAGHGWGGVPFNGPEYPELNVMSWYIIKGEPHWDADKLWTCMEHLYKSGMWFKKKAKIAEANHITTQEMSTKGADGIDWRTEYSGFDNTNNSIVTGAPSESDINDYFFVPSLGRYDSKVLSQIGQVGYFWLRRSYPANEFMYQYIYFNKLGVFSDIETCSEAFGGMLTIPYSSGMIVQPSFWK